MTTSWRGKGVSFVAKILTSKTLENSVMYSNDTTIPSWRMGKVFFGRSEKVNLRNSKQQCTGSVPLRLHKATCPQALKLRKLGRRIFPA